MAIEYDDIQLKINSVLESTKGIDKTLSALGDLADADISNTTEEVKEFAKAVDSVNPSTLELAKKAADKYRHAWHHGRSPQNGRTENLDGNYTSSATAMFSGAGDQIEKATRSLEDYKRIVDEIKQESQKPTLPLNNASAFKEAIDKIIERWKEFLRGLRDADPPLQRLLNKFKRFLEYRAMRAIWSAIVNSIKEGIKNLEEWDRNTGHTGFADSMDRARESLLALKNSLAVITAPGLEWLIGVLQKVATWAITAANAISRFFAILGDKGSYRTVKWADTIASSEEKAAGSAKKATQEFKKQLMAFDEINNITAQNQGGSGGGGGSSASAKYTDMFGTEEVGELSDVEKKIKAVWEWIKKIGDELKPIFTRLKTLKDTLTSMWDTTVKLASAVGGWMAKFADPVWSGFKTTLKSIVEFAVALGTAIGSAYDAIANIIIAVGTMLDAFGMWKKIGGDINLILQTFAGLLDGASKQVYGLALMFEMLALQANYVAEYFANLKAFLDGDISFKQFTANVQKAKQDLENNMGKAVDDLRRKMDAAFNRSYNVDVNINEKVTVSGSTGPLNPRTYGFGFASGGYVNSGQLFVAREAGPELVGSIGSHTAVANNDQIVSAVSQGVASAVASVLGNQGTNVNVTLEGDAKGLFKVVQKEGRAYSARTGQPALA